MGRKTKINQIGRYRIDDTLGKGGMAVVYRAYDPRFEREVAVKVMAAELVDSSEFRLRFEREARALGALQHPAIVPVYDFGEEDGQLYLVMAYMSGGSLNSRLSGGPFPPDQVALIWEQLAPAIDMAHQNNIVHRDLKPDNILFDQHGHPYISDFGIAKLLTDTSPGLTRTGVFLGTRLYTSPEQAGGEKVDGRSDIYSLGIILFEMLTGRHPCSSGSFLDLLSPPLPSILSIAPDVPPGCQAIFERAVAKERDARYTTASEMAFELKMVVERHAVPVKETRIKEIEHAVPQKTKIKEVEPKTVDQTDFQRSIIDLIEHAKTGFTAIIGTHSHTAEDGDQAYESQYKLEDSARGRIWKREDGSIVFSCYFVNKSIPLRSGHQYDNEQARNLFHDKVAEIRLVLPK